MCFSFQEVQIVILCQITEFLFRSNFAYNFCEFIIENCYVSVLRVIYIWRFLYGFSWRKSFTISLLISEFIYSRHIGFQYGQHINIQYQGKRQVSKIHHQVIPYSCMILGREVINGIYFNNRVLIWQPSWI